jgi:hypothetical protein
MNAYEKDLRVKVLSAIDRGIPRKEVQELFGVSRSDQLVTFQLHGSTVPILCVLDQEHYQERNDGRAGIYDQLPGIAEPKQRAASSPN